MQYSVSDMGYLSSSSSRSCKLVGHLPTWGKFTSTPFISQLCHHSYIHSFFTMFFSRLTACFLRTSSPLPLTPSVPPPLPIEPFPDSSPRFVHPRVHHPHSLLRNHIKNRPYARSQLLSHFLRQSPLELILAVCHDQVVQMLTCD